MNCSNFGTINSHTSQQKFADSTNKKKKTEKNVSLLLNWKILNSRIFCCLVVLDVCCAVPGKNVVFTLFVASRQYRIQNKMKQNRIKSLCNFVSDRNITL